MPITLKIILSLFILFIIGVACSDENTQSSNNVTVIRQPINPNGDSELALLMRAMFEEAQQIKQQINQGDSITLSLDHEKILTAHATEPTKAASPEYKAFVKTYLHTVNKLMTANPTEKMDVYRSLVGNCMACHKALCPGPLVKIKKLYQ